MIAFELPGRERPLQCNRLLPSASQRHRHRRLRLGRSGPRREYEHRFRSKRRRQCGCPGLSTRSGEGVRLKSKDCGSRGQLRHGPLSVPHCQRADRRAHTELRTDSSCSRLQGISHRHSIWVDFAAIANANPSADSRSNYSTPRNPGVGSNLDWARRKS
jgi:hypothetical protein